MPHRFQRLVLSCVAAGVAVLLLPLGANAAEAHCFCKITFSDLEGIQTANSVILDLTGEVGKTYRGVNPQREENQSGCNSRCRDTSAKYIGRPSIAAAACASGAHNGTPVEAWSAVGTGKYRAARLIGVLVNKPAVTQTTCVCPPGSVGNSSNQPGGTTDSKCKQKVGTITATPRPPNGTPIGTWGFTWLDEIWQYVSPSCTTVTTSQAECHFR